MENTVEFAKCLSDETRLKILVLLAGGDLCVGEMVEALGAPQSRVSQHLMRLRRDGLVTCSREGQWVIYSLDSKALRKKLRAMKKFLFANSPDA